MSRKLLDSNHWRCFLLELGNPSFVNPTSLILLVGFVFCHRWKTLKGSFSWKRIYSFVRLYPYVARVWYTLTQKIPYIRWCPIFLSLCLYLQSVFSLGDSHLAKLDKIYPLNIHWGLWHIWISGFPRNQYEGSAVSTSHVFSSVRFIIGWNNKLVAVLWISIAHLSLGKQHRCHLFLS